jgi:hypothetical protein
MEDGVSEELVQEHPTSALRQRKLGRGQVQLLETSKQLIFGQASRTEAAGHIARSAITWVCPLLSLRVYECLLHGLLYTIGSIRGTGGDCPGSFQQDQIADVPEAVLDDLGAITWVCPLFMNVCCTVFYIQQAASGALAVTVLEASNKIRSRTCRKLFLMISGASTCMRQPTTASWTLSPKPDEYRSA